MVRGEGKKVAGRKGLDSGSLSRKAHSQRHKCC